MEQALHHELIERFDAKLNDAMRMYLDTCARCGVCIQSCHVYASMPVGGALAIVFALPYLWRGRPDH